MTLLLRLNFNKTIIMNAAKSVSIKPHRLGEISNATFRTQDLLKAFQYELKELFRVNALALDEHASKQIVGLIAEADEYLSAMEGDELSPDDDGRASECVDEIADVFNMHFCAPYVSFGSHEGDGACFGFWPSVDQAKEDCGFVSARSHTDAEKLGIETDPNDSAFPPADYEGEWLHVSDHGNATLYVRADGQDTEIWSVV